MIKNSFIKKGIFIFIALVILSQIVIILAAIQLTYFRDDSEKATFFNKISFSQKNIIDYKNQKEALTSLVQSGKENIEIWEKTIDSAKGTIILFHGYLGNKKALSENANLFNKMGFNTILVDFRASGNSEGNFTTIGYLEAENVKTVYEYAQKKYNNITLYGISMGAASIMRATSVYDLQPERIILECPFSTMRQTIANRFERFHVPQFLLVDLLTFWGGKIHGFDAFQHNPVDYAKDIHVPTLLMSGDADPNVKNFETDQIFNALGTHQKNLYYFHQAGHENYIFNYLDEWYQTVYKFINTSTL